MEKYQKCINLLKVYFSSVIIERNSIVLITPFYKYISFFINLLKFSSVIQANSLLDIFVVDHPQRKSRFEIIYVLVSIKFNCRFIIKTRVKVNECVPTVSHIFSAANWLEREAWDMFGIPFSNHRDMRRILTDYGFRGHPLRKDFPLTGFVEIRFDEEKKIIVSEPVELTQEFRFFEFKAPWNTKI